jgi:Ankyrin repeats (3 copies)
VDANHDYRSYEQWRALPKFIKKDKQMEKQIRSLSGGLAELKTHVGMSDKDSADDNDDRKENQFVQFVHQSVKDFLISKGFCHFINSELQKPNSSSTDIAIGQAHFELSRSCVRYISMEEIPLSPFKDRELASEFCLLQYATMNWISHAEAAEKVRMTQADLLQTFQWPSTRILHHWIDLCRQFGPFSRNTPSQSSTLLHIASKHGLFTLVKAILNSKDNWEVDINAEDSDKNTALHWAIENDREDIVALLLIKGAKAEGLYTPPVRKPSRCPSSRSLTSASLIVIACK